MKLYAKKYDSERGALPVKMMVIGGASLMVLVLLIVVVVCCAKKRNKTEVIGGAVNKRRETIHLSRNMLKGTASTEQFERDSEQHIIVKETPDVTAERKNESSLCLPDSE